MVRCHIESFVLAFDVLIETRYIPWAIMTSSQVHKDTVEYFESQNYFGLPRESVTFFMQEDFPTLTPDGRMLLQGKGMVRFVLIDTEIGRRS